MSYAAETPSAETRIVRLAQNQALYRHVNEEIRQVAGAWGEPDAAGRRSWICECADPDCTTRICATLDEYESIRRQAARFLVYCGHVFPEAERVVEGNERFTVVEKTGIAAEIARQAFERPEDAGA